MSDIETRCTNCNTELEHHLDSKYDTVVLSVEPCEECMKDAEEEAREKERSER